MPRTKTTPTEPVSPSEPSPAAGNGLAAEVLTLAEAAAYLRLAEKAVLSAAATQGLPGRLIDEEWRFLKSAIQEWLSGSQPTAEMRKAAQMAIAGSCKDDPYLEDMVEEIYRRRGRPITEDGSYRLFHGLKAEDLPK